MKTEIERLFYNCCVHCSIMFNHQNVLQPSNKYFWFREQNSSQSSREVWLTHPVASRPHCFIRKDLKTI